MAVTKDDVLDVLIRVLGDDLEFFGSEENRRAGAELLIQESPEVQAFYYDVLQVLRNNEGTLEHTKEAIAGGRAVESSLLPDEVEIRARLADELKEAASSTLDSLEAERLANLSLADEVAVSMLTREGIVDPLLVKAVRVTPPVREALAATPTEEHEVFEKGWESVVSSTVPAAVRESYYSIIGEAEGIELSSRRDYERWRSEKQRMVEVPRPRPAEDERGMFAVDPEFAQAEADRARARQLAEEVRTTTEKTAMKLAAQGRESNEERQERAREIAEAERDAGYVRPVQDERGMFAVGPEPTGDREARREADRERARQMAEEARDAAGGLSYAEQVALDRQSDEERARGLAEGARESDEERATSLAEAARRGEEMAALQGDQADPVPAERQIGADAGLGLMDGRSPFGGPDRTPEQLALVHEFGWGSAFLNHRAQQGDLVIGLLNGVPVAFDTPGAEQVFLVDYVERAGLDAETAAGMATINELFTMTQYHQEASVHTQAWEEAWYNAGAAEQDAILRPAEDIIEGMLQYFGQDFSPGFVRDLAFEASRLGMLEDNEFMIDAVTSHAEFDLMRSQTSASVQQAEDIRQMARTYFSDVPEAQAREWVISINEGSLTFNEVEHMIRQQAAARFPELAGFIGDGQTVKGYFATHQAAMEDMLGRPVDIYREFPQLYSGEIATQDDARRLVRSTSEWRQSADGQDSARLMSYQLGQMFGETA